MKHAGYLGWSGLAGLIVALFFLIQATPAAPGGRGELAAVEGRYHYRLVCDARVVDQLPVASDPVWEVGSGDADRWAMERVGQTVVVRAKQRPTGSDRLRSLAFVTRLPGTTLDSLAEARGIQVDRLPEEDAEAVAATCSGLGDVVVPATREHDMAEVMLDLTQVLGRDPTPAEMVAAGTRLDHARGVLDARRRLPRELVLGLRPALLLVVEPAGREAIPVQLVPSMDAHDQRVWTVDPEGLVWDSEVDRRPAVRRLQPLVGEMAVPAGDKP